MESFSTDTRRLAHFLAVLEAGGVREAARRIHVAQPALSRTIAELEEDLGLALFVRSGRRLVPTEAGLRVGDDARAVLRELEGLVARARAVAGGHEGRLRLGTSPSATFHPLVPSLVRGYRDAHPRMEVELTEGPSASLIEAVRTHSVDVAFVRQADPLPPPLTSLPLARERLVAVVSDADPLARHRRLTVERVLEEPLLLPPETSGSSLARWVRDAARERGVPIRVAATASHAASLVHLAASGMGVALVPESVASMRTRGVRHVPLATRSRLVLSLVFREDVRVPTVQAFVALARRAR